MSNNQKFIVKVNNATHSSGVIDKLVGTIPIKSFVSLISKTDLDANPRKAKENAITAAIQETLKDSPAHFQFMTKGVLYAATRVSPLDRGRYAIEVLNPEREGVLDGGHNTFATAKFILDETGYEKCAEIKKWDDLKAAWKEHENQILELVDLLPDASMPVEFLFPAEGDTGFADFEESILQISAARNNNVQLRETAKANKQGLYDEVKTNLDSSISDETEWREGEGGRIKPADLAAMALIIFGALPEAKYPNAAFLKNNPNLLFSSKGKCVELYNEFLLNQEGVAEKVDGGARKEVVDETVKSALGLMKDLPRLFDQIYQEFPFAYNSASPGFGRMNSVKTLDPIKWKSDKKKYLKKPAKSRYYQTACEYQYPEGFIYPLFVGLRELIQVDGSTVKWKSDPERFIKDKLGIVLSSGYQAIIRGQDFNPAQVGKLKGSYELVSNMYRVAEHL